MKTLALLALSLAVALAMPAPPGVAQSPDLIKEEQSPLVGDLVPEQGHVEVEDPAPQPRLESKEQLEKSSPEVKVEQELKEEPEVKVEQEPKAEPEVKVEQELKEEPKDKVEQEPKAEPEVKVEQELKEEPDVQVEQDSMAEKDSKEEPEPNLIADPDFKVESEVKVEPDPQMEPEPEEEPLFYVQEEPEMQMNFEDLGQGVEERHIDMESQIINEPIGELEPMDDDKMFGEEESDAELSEVEKSIQASFINEGLPVVEPQPDFVDENPEALLDGAIMDEGPALDIMGQPISTFDNFFPYEGAREGMEKTNAGAQLDLAPENDENTLTRQGERHYLTIEGKGYHFFTGPKRAEEAEFFCQSRFTGGHLASITSPRVHREVMDMIVQISGSRTRTWVGGLRYLKTGRFIWLDGSHWDYADWLSGEPNNTSELEDCIELLASSNGQFNDFTCWEPQTFLCSFPVQ